MSHRSNERNAEGSTSGSEISVSDESASSEWNMASNTAEPMLQKDDLFKTKKVKKKCLPEDEFVPRDLDGLLLPHEESDV